MPGRLDRTSRSLRDGQQHAVCSGLDLAQPAILSERQLDDACCGAALRVDGKAAQPWREIAAEAAKETDPKKLVEMIERLCEVLETMRLEARKRAECIYACLRLSQELRNSVGK
ncbi:MAG TPA: hypothetical protein VF905_07935 [Nitrospirota bacterium]